MKTNKTDIKFLGGTMEYIVIAIIGYFIFKFLIGLLSFIITLFLELFGTYNITDEELEKLLNELDNKQLDEDTYSSEYRNQPDKNQECKPLSNAFLLGIALMFLFGSDDE